MSSATSARTAPTSPGARPVGGASLVVVLSFLLGALTSYAQGVLPEMFSSVANSAGGWTLITVLLIAAIRARPVAAAALGAASFVLLTLGYTVASSLRGHSYHPFLFSLVGLLVGPFVGLATVWLRERDLRSSLATALLSGIAVGEAVYGLTVIGGSTSPVYWTLSGLTGLGLLAGMVTRRIRGSVAITTAVGGTAVVAAGFLAVYQNY
jgi:uncharacterized membrane protein YccF (DUF307 family)